MHGVGVPGRLFGSLARLAMPVLAVLAPLPVLAADADGDFKILYFESLAPLPASQLASAQQKETDSAAPQKLTFDAYGRRFELTLERNAKVMQDTAGTAIAYRGDLANQPGSWTRLTRIGNELHGLVWDGSDLYVIEPASVASEFTGAPLVPGQGGNLIYRLSDTLVDLGADFCSAMDEAPEAATDGLTTFKAVTEDLKSHTILQQAAGATLGLRLSVLGDASLRARYATEAEARDALLVRLNNVDGIFSAQLGVEVQITSVSIYDDASDPFSSTRDSGNLLSQLGSLRNNSPSLRTDGLSHLFTGRDLTGRDQNGDITNLTIGIAYINSLCSNRFGAGITEARGRGSVLESLVAAHEIGHNFGARHDNDPSFKPWNSSAPSSCGPSVPYDYLMAPQADEDNDSFSQCSLDTISRSIEQAACITSLPPADVSVTLAPAPTLTIGQTFTWSATVTNIGGQQATGVTLDLTLPAGISVDDATVAGGSCSNGAGVVQCALGNLAVSDSRTVGLALRAQSSGLFNVSATAAASNDSNTANNAASTTLAIDATAPATGNPAVANPSSGGGGGGGTMQLAQLLSLGLLAFLRRRRPVPA